MNYSGAYFVHGLAHKKDERRYLLSIFNAINDQGFGNWALRGATVNYVFGQDEEDETLFKFRFIGCSLGIILDLKNSRFYFYMEEDGVRRMADFYDLPEWKLIDKWMEQGKIYD
jgi:hypothetical protein